MDELSSLKDELSGSVLNVKSLAEREAAQSVELVNAGHALSELENRMDDETHLRDVCQQEVRQYTSLYMSLGDELSEQIANKDAESAKVAALELLHQELESERTS